MKILVCGGRDFRDEDFVYATLDGLFEELRFDVLIQGGANGADAVAASWAANHREVHGVTVWAKWHIYGKRAGHMRNSAMLMLSPDLVVAFPGGKGTRNMIAQAKACEIEVRDYADSYNGSAFYSRDRAASRDGGAEGVGGD